VFAFFVLGCALYFGTKLFSQWVAVPACKNEITQMTVSSIWLIATIPEPQDIVGKLIREYGNPKPACATNCSDHFKKGTTKQRNNCIKDCAHILPPLIKETINKNVSLIQTVILCIVVFWMIFPILEIWDSTQVTWVVKSVYFVICGIEACIAYSYKQAVCQTSADKWVWQEVKNTFGPCAHVFVVLTILQCYIVWLNRKRKDGLLSMFAGSLPVKFLVVVLIALYSLEVAVLIGDSGSTPPSPPPSGEESSSSSSQIIANDEFKDQVYRMFNDWKDLVMGRTKTQ
jgi:hypothetical protein